MKKLTIVALMATSGLSVFGVVPEGDLTLEQEKKILNAVKDFDQFNPGKIQKDFMDKLENGFDINEADLSVFGVVPEGDLTLEQEKKILNAVKDFDQFNPGKIQKDFMDKLENVFDINEADDKGMTLLHQAVSENNKIVVEALIRNHADVSKVDNNGKNALHYACEVGNLQIVKLLVKNSSDPAKYVNTVDNDGRTTIHYALLNSKPISDSFEGYSRLTNEDVVNYLIYKGVDINAVDNTGKTALNFFLSRPFTQKKIKVAFPELFESHISPGYRSVTTQSAHDKVVTYGALAVSNFINSMDFDVNKSDNDGIAPIHWACINFYPENVEALIISGANVNAVDNDGKTVLHYACENDQINLCEILIKKDADITIADNDGKTASDIATKNKFVTIANLLSRTKLHRESLEKRPSFSSFTDKVRVFFINLINKFDKNTGTDVTEKK